MSLKGRANPRRHLGGRPSREQGEVGVREAGGRRASHGGRVAPLPSRLCPGPEPRCVHLLSRPPAHQRQVCCIEVNGTGSLFKLRTNPLCYSEPMKL